MSNSALAEVTIMSPNCGNYVNNKLVKNRLHKIDTITIHHMANIFSVETCGNGFADPKRGGSSNYGIDSDGRIGLYVPEEIRAWTSGSPDNDNRAVTIEVSNDKLAPTWHVSDKALDSLINLCVDICKRNGIDKLNWTGNKTGNLTIHRFFQNTLCPGPYLESKMAEIAEKVNTILHPPVEVKKIYRVQTGAYKYRAYAEKMAAKLKADGFSTYIIEKDGIIRVQVGAFRVKENAEKTAAALRKKGYSCFITSPEVYSISEPVEKIKVGDIVKCKSGVTKYYGGMTMPAWVRSANLYVRQIEQNGKVYLVSTEPVKEVYTGRVNASDVEKI